MKQTSQKTLFKTVLTAMLIAMQVVLERFLSYNVWNQRIGFSFLPIAFAAAFLGAPWAMITAGVGDIIGAILFPTGPYFPGFTLTAVLTAFCTAFFIHKNATLPRIIASVLINQLFGTLLLNSLWISIVYGAHFKALFITRLLEAGIHVVIQILLIFLLFGQKSHVRKSLEKAIGQYIC